MKRGELIYCICDKCGDKFQLLQKYKKDILSLDISAKNRTQGKFCSRKCSNSSKDTRVLVRCEECGAPIFRRARVVHGCKHNFCSFSCAGTYNAKHKTTGSNRSKLEIWLESKLPTLYPDLIFRFNDKLAIQAELDIFIPSLNLAFELNGIFHYENIFKNLSKVQERDRMKVTICSQVGISLCVIDTSKQCYFKEKTCLPFLRIIQKIIDSRIKEIAENPPLGLS